MNVKGKRKFVWVVIWVWDIACWMLGAPVCPLVRPATFLIIIVQIQWNTHRW